MKNVLKLLAKSILIPLGLPATASETDADIQKEIHDSGTTFLILNKEMKDTMKIINSHGEFGLLI